MTIKRNGKIQIGINARLFPKNWRPIREEIAFSKENGFQAIQVRGTADGLNKSVLGADLEEVGSLLKKADLTAVMEINLSINDNGLTEENKTPLEVLQANLPAITTLPCPLVHWHLFPQDRTQGRDISRLEEMLIPQFAAAVALARKFGFHFGFEHNDPDYLLFSKPESCLTALRQVPGLGFVWDFNHVTPENLAEFHTMTPWMSMLHISDTILPDVNFHLPLGLGNIDLVNNFRALHKGSFSGPAILEIGGLPKSGGYGRDTDEALISSRQLLEQSILKSMTPEKM